MKILVIRFSSIGDIVLCSPALRWLKNKYPEAEVHFLCKKQFAGLVDQNPYVDKVWPLLDFKPTAKALKAEKFDLVVDLHKNLRSYRFRWAIKSPRRVSFKKLSLAKYWSVRFKKPSVLPQMHIVDRYAEGLRYIGVENDGLGLSYYGETEPDFFSELPEAYNILVAGAAHNTKKLPESLIQKIHSHSDLPVVVLGTEADNKDIFSKIDVLNLCGKTNLNESAYIIKHAHTVYTSDTGLMHIAAAFGKNIHVFWGNTIPEFGMYPYLTTFTNHEVKNLSCRPCSKIGFAECPKGHFKCMEDQVI